MASQVDTILSFFKYFSFLCDLGCFGMVVLARLPTADIYVCLIKNIFVEFIGKFIYNINRDGVILSIL